MMKVGLEIFSGIWGGQQKPLVLGWGVDQLTPVVEALDPFLPDHLPGMAGKAITQEMKCAAAACARSLFVEFRSTGQPLRYSRSKNHYGEPDRYQRSGIFYSWHFVTRAMDVLQQAGLVKSDLGEWSGPHGGGRQSVARPSDVLLELLEPVIDIEEQRGDLREAEVIVLRDLADKKNIDYDDTAETAALRSEVRRFNSALARVDLFLNERRFPIPPLRRVFNGTFQRGGRFYHHGPSYQNKPSEERRDLQTRIGGTFHRMVEVDYANLHAVMAYTEAGVPVPPGDLYAIDGISRPVVKRAFNILLNAAARHKAVAALGEDLAMKDDALWQASGLATQYRGECHSFAEIAISAIEDKHRHIAGYFSSDCGARFQRRDSDMAAAVMSRVLRETGRCPLVEHDSLLVPDIDHEVLIRVMHEVAGEEGLPLCLKDSEGQSWPPPPLRLPPSFSTCG